MDIKLGEQVNVKVGAVIVGIHKIEPACMLVLESELERAILVPNSYVEKSLDPQEIIKDHDMLDRAFKDQSNWEMLEGVENPFSQSES